MNFLTLNKPHATYQLISMILLGFTLFLTSTFSISATLPSGANTPPTELGREFNHLTTGFPLLGEHATIECATCHLNGVFKGTPKNCTGCHVKGQRIVATTMSAKHIPTNERCELCHSNSVTFYGAKFSHIGSNVIVGGCRTCHNGMTAEGRPTSSHATGARLTDSCDKCHRTTAWFPAGYSHAGVVAGSCKTCHSLALPSSNHTSSVVSTHTSRQGSCDDCHNYIAWLPAFFRHTGLAASADCGGSGCHAAGLNTGISLSGPFVIGLQPISNNGATLPHSISTCRSCHTTVGTFLNAVYGHVGVAQVCTTCHVLPAGHGGGATAAQCDTCHVKATWYGAAGAMPANHIPFNAGASCASCHVGNNYTAKVAVSPLHINSNATTCFACHISPNPYTGNNQSTKKNHSGSSGNNCTNCHKGAASYSNWGN
jgi:hypothetical protein